MNNGRPVIFCNGCGMSVPYLKDHIAHPGWWRCSVCFNQVSDQDMPKMSAIPQRRSTDVSAKK